MHEKDRKERPSGNVGGREMSNTIEHEIIWLHDSWFDHQAGCRCLKWLSITQMHRPSVVAEYNRHVRDANAVHQSSHHSGRKMGSRRMRAKSIR